MNIVTGILYWAFVGLSALLVVGSIWMGWWVPAIFAAFCTAMWTVGGRFVFGAGWRPPLPPLPRPTRRPVVRRRPR